MSLQRRTSTVLIRTRSKSTPKRLLCYAQAEFAPDLPSPRVPPELVDRIVELALSNSAADHIPNFRSIAPLTLASVDFRHIALRRFFRDITLLSKTHWTGLFKLLEAQDEGKTRKNGNEGFAWVKTLCASSRTLLSKPTRLPLLIKLRILSIDLAQEGLSTQHPSILELFRHLKSTSAAIGMKSLTLSSLPRIDVVLLRLIAETLPNLTDLYLSCTERLEYGCCWLCFEDSLTCTIHSPLPDDYSDFRDMVYAFSTALKPLTNLTHLRLGIFLSDDRLLYSHMSHCLGDEESTEMVQGMFFCPTCLNEAFGSVQMRELAASRVMAQNFTALRSVGWSTLFNRYSDKVTDGQDMKSEDEQSNDRYDWKGNVVSSGTEDETRTTIRIFRNNGKIRVRRMPSIIDPQLISC